MEKGPGTEEETEAEEPSDDDSEVEFENTGQVLADAMGKLYNKES